ncbi:hypothetical protein BRARA_E01964 [Brassica rapa]|uniref:TTF-type domain-containing protein n=1 Tax=Brassica campestris TaxID=3711 RepID=A0A397ZBN0_BRACM|nr:hypothetical protein BRARA_E01964 [Brassica rapa]
MDYPANQRDEVRRRYLTKGPCQPYGHNFKQISKGSGTRRFNPAWFDQYGSWLEYSISKESAFCLYCYLFKDEVRMQGGSDAFVKEGFNNWKKPERLLTHMGKPPSSCHIIAAQKCEDLMNQHQSIVHALFKQDDKAKNEYRIRLNASIDASRFLLRQGLPFRGHGEKEEDANKRNFLELLKYTGEHNEAISKKDQDILNAMSLVESIKRELQKLRDDGWDSLMAKVASFCKKHSVEMLIMEEDFVDLRNPRKRTNISNMHHYKVNCFCTVLDLQIQEFNDRFTEVTTDLLICMAALSPIDSFHGFDKEKLVRLAKLYPDDFSYGELLSLEQQLDIYIDNIRRDERFKSVENLGDFSCLMVKTQKHLAHPLMFSAMKLVKTAARNRIGDQFLSDCMVCFIEKELFDSISNEKVIKNFQMMNKRRVVL